MNERINQTAVKSTNKIFPIYSRLKAKLNRTNSYKIDKGSV